MDTNDRSAASVGAAHNAMIVTKPNAPEEAVTAIQHDDELLVRKVAGASDAQLRVWLLDSRREIQRAASAEQRRRAQESRLADPPLD